MGDFNWQIPSVLEITAYSDAELERLLKQSKDRNLSELARLQVLVATKFAEAHEAYRQEKSEIKAAIRRYYLLIFIEFFIEFVRFFRGLSPKATRTGLKNQKSSLKETFEEISAELELHMSALTSALDKIADLSEHIEMKEEQVAALREVIEHSDSSLTQQERLEVREKLDLLVKERDEALKDSAYLYMKIETIMNSVAEMLGLDSLKSDLAYHQTENQTLLAKIQQACQSIEHPLAEKLQYFLTYQTTIALQNFTTAFHADKTYQNNRDLTDVIWRAALLYPELTTGLNRTVEFLAYLTPKVQELSTLEDVMDYTDAMLRRQDKKEMRQQLDDVFLVQRRTVYDEIYSLYLTNKDLVVDPVLMAQCESIRRIVEAKELIYTLMSICKQLQHPVAESLHNFLKYQTASSLHALREAISKSSNYQDSRPLTDALWKAGEIFPGITSGMVREQELLSILDRQDMFHADEFMKNAALLAELEAEIETLIADRASIIEDIEGFKDASKLWNTDLNDVYQERQVLKSELETLLKLPMNNQGDMFNENSLYRRKIEPMKKSIRALTNESLRIVGNLSRNAKQQEAAELKLDDSEGRLIELQALQMSQVKHIQQSSVNYTQADLIALQKKCNPGAWFDKPNPVMAALGNFLHHPIPSLLMKLRIAMVAHKDYKAHAQIAQLVDEASRFYPEIHAQDGEIEKLFIRKASSSGVEPIEDEEGDGGQSQKMK